MGKFSKIVDRNIHKRVLILGSYHPDNFQALLDLQNYIKETGVPDVFLAKDLGLIDESLTGDEKKAQLLISVEKEMEKADFNLFLIFISRNESTIVELTSFVKSASFSTKKERTLVLIPRDADFSMLSGLLTKEKLRCFQYDSIFDIFPFVSQFVLFN